MIGKVCPRGRRVAGLIRYLYATGPAQQERRGRRNPHTDPRVVAGFDEPGKLEPAVRWRDIAETYRDRLGLAPRGDDLAAGVPTQRLLAGG